MGFYKLSLFSLYFTFQTLYSAQRVVVAETITDEN